MVAFLSRPNTIILGTSGWADGSDGVGAFFVARRPAEALRNAHRWGRATSPAARAERRRGRRPNRCHRAQPGGDRRGRPDHRRSATSVKWILSVVGQVDPALHCPAQRRRVSAARDVSGVTETGTLAGPRSRHSGFTEEGFTVVDARCWPYRIEAFFTAIDESVVRLPRVVTWAVSGLAHGICARASL